MATAAPANAHSSAPSHLKVRPVLKPHPVPGDPHGATAPRPPASSAPQTSPAARPTSSLARCSAETPRPNIHPSEVLQKEFLNPFTLSAYRLAQDLYIPQTRVSAILKGKRRITADTALRLGRCFGNSPKFWLGLQDDYDLEEEQAKPVADWEIAPLRKAA